MENHEISIGDVYNLMRETREDVITMKSELRVVLDKTNSHEARLLKAELELSDVRHKTNDVKELEKSINELTKKVYAFSGGATVMGALVGTIINLVVKG